MAIAYGGSVGTPVNDTENAAASIALTTGTIPANSFIVMFVSWYAASGTASMGGGSLTWSGQDASKAGVADTSHHIAMFSAQNPSGISAQTLTGTVPAGSFGRAIFGVYFTGIATSSAKDVSSAGNQGTTAVWSTGTATTTVGDTVLVGGCWFDGIVGTNGQDGTDTEALDFNNALNASWCAEYRILTATNTLGVGGTWSGGTTPEWIATMTAYKADTGAAAAAASPRSFNAIPFIGGVL